MIKCHSRERSYAAGIKWIAYSGFLFHYYLDPIMNPQSFYYTVHVQLLGFSSVKWFSGRAQMAPVWDHPQM